MYMFLLSVQVMQQMTFCGDARWSVILADQFGLDILNMSEIKVQVLHRVQAICYLHFVNCTFMYTL
mgnify:CR=1 FL=1